MFHSQPWTCFHQALQLGLWWGLFLNTKLNITNLSKRLDEAELPDAEISLVDDDIIDTDDEKIKSWYETNSFILKKYFSICTGYSRILDSPKVFKCLLLDSPNLSKYLFDTPGFSKSP